MGKVGFSGNGDSSGRRTEEMVGFSAFSVSGIAHFCKSSQEGDHVPFLQFKGLLPNTEPMKHPKERPLSQVISIGIIESLLTNRY
jgi:hypothetical protein